MLEKLWTAARCFHSAADRDAEDWVATHAARLLNGSIDATVTAFNAQATSARTGAFTCVKNTHVSISASARPSTD